MRLRKYLFIICFCSLVMVEVGVSGEDKPVFGQRVDLGLVASPFINEASGLAASRADHNVLWTHNDSGDAPKLYAFGTDGRDLGAYEIDDAVNRDWEDLAIGPGPVTGVTYLYVADIGDNNGVYSLKHIYRIPEPAVSFGQGPKDTLIKGAETITFRYPMENYDAETLLVDPLTKDLYVATKDDNNTIIFRASYPQSTSQINDMEVVATLNIAGTVGGDISLNGREILLKTYTTIYYWCRAPEEPIGTALARQAITVPYSVEPQGEAVCWDASGSGYFTVSEESPLQIPPHLNNYPRLSTSVGKAEDITSFELGQNYPNPFNPTTNIEFSIPRVSNTRLTIYDILGREIEVLVNRRLQPGAHRVVFDARDLQTGVYFYSLETNQSRQATLVKKLVVVK